MGEGIEGTTHEKIRVIRQKRGDTLEDIGRVIDALIAVAESYDDRAIKQKLKEIVPEYTPQ